MVNSILWGNLPREISGNPEVRYSLVQRGFPGEGNIRSDPRFCDATCGHFSDLALAADSPCIGAGEEGTDIGAWGPDCDLPAVHDPLVIEVPRDHSSIREALADACDADTVLIAPGTYREGMLEIPPLDLTVRGRDPQDRAIVASTVIDGGGDDVLLFDPAPPGARRALAGLTITGGGSGIVCNETSPLIDRCAIVGNDAAVYGGGIRSIRSSPTIVGCSISRNRASIGAGVFCEDGAPEIRNCIIFENSAGRTGGGLHSFRSSASLLNCTVTSNEAGEDGGGFSSRGSSPRVTNCIVWGDAPDEMGDGDPVVTYSGIEGGFPGEGNIALDPRLSEWRGLSALPNPIDRWVGDTYMLRSPCIDAGDPVINDGVSDRHPRWPPSYANEARSDMGAYGGPGNWRWAGSLE